MFFAFQGEKKEGKSVIERDKQTERETFIALLSLAAIKGIFVAMK